MNISNAIFLPKHDIHYGQSLNYINLEEKDYFKNETLLWIPTQCRIESGSNKPASSLWFTL